MKITERRINLNSRLDEIRLYPIGDVHMGALNCAEEALKRLVHVIANDDNAYWFGGGDMTDSVIINDIKRFDVNTIPSWMLKGDPEKIRERVGDILDAQCKRLAGILKPICGRKCLGLIEGNHEYSIFKHHNRDHMKIMCTMLAGPDGKPAENLSDCAFIRLNFSRVVNSTSSSHRNEYPGTSVIVFITHGYGGGRTPGAAPTCLYRLAADKDADILFMGHSHTFCIHPPIPVLYIPSRGKLLEEACVKDKFAANWGSFMYTYKSGPSTYASRSSYPVRPMYTVETTIKPFGVECHKGKKLEIPLITMRQIKL